MKNNSVKPLPCNGSKIEKLIAELCPEGVEFKKLGEVGEFVRGHGLPKSDFTESGVGCIHYGQIYTYYGTFTDRTKSFVSPETARRLKKVRKNNLIITNTSENIEDVCKAVVWLGNDEIVTGGHASIFKHHENPKYLAYYTQTHIFFTEKRKLAKGTKVIDVSAKDLAKIPIPIPPLEVQEAIVKILDTFTTLEAELEAELEARKQQYEYYRDELLTFGEDVESLSFDNIIISLRTGLNPRKNFKLNPPNAKNYYITVRELDGFDICISDKTDRVNDEGLTLIQNRSKLRAGDILFSGTGTIGRTALVTKSPSNWNIKEGIYAITPNPKIIDARFLVHLLHSGNIRRQILSQADGSTVSSISMTTLRKVKIPIPPLAEQERIVAILDKFDALVNDISIGLPAEIEARSKQYEYYREKLLTFQEKP